jgi:hypothetical protein
VPLELVVSDSETVVDVGAVVDALAALLVHYHEKKRADKVRTGTP